jgi:Tol biopolymer transport system component
MTEKPLNSEQKYTDGAESAFTETALESWKEIAAYLQRDVRTVTRWEKSEGLPIYRHLHKSRASVYAYPSELDTWRAGRKPQEEVISRRGWLGPAHAYAILLIAAICVISVGTGSQVGAAGNESPQFQQVMLNTALPNIGGKLSPAGEKFAFVSGGSLWIAPVDPNKQPVGTGTPVRLTEPMGAWDKGGIAIAWSGDSRWIAFRTDKAGTRDNPGSIYLISSSGGKPRLAATNEGWLNYWGYSIALSPKGDKVYFADGRVLRTMIYETPVGSNDRRPITGIDTFQPAISPDGAWIAYLKFDAETKTTNQVWAMPVSGGEPSLVCEASPGGFLRSPIWSPDGSKIAFLVKPPNNNFGDCTEIWMVPMGPEGHPSGAPEKFALRKNTNFLIAGWTEQNNIGLLFDAPHSMGLYVAPAKGGQVAQITDFWSTYPRWSPDGRTIYFRADANDAYWGIFRIPASGGNRTELSFQGVDLGIPIPGGGPVLSPDGSRLCFAGVRRTDAESTKRFPSTLYIVDSGGGEPAPLMEPGSRGGRAPTWSPDGNFIAFTKREPPGEPQDRRDNLYVISDGGGNLHRISVAGDQVEGSSAGWSPDGELIAYLGRDSTLRVIPATGGSSRVLASNLGPVRGEGVTWSPDGQEIAFTAGGRIWKVSRSGGEPSEIRIPLQGTPGQIDWSPDGKHLVVEFDSEQKIELWLMKR